MSIQDNSICFIFIGHFYECPMNIFIFIGHCPLNLHFFKDILIHDMYQTQDLSSQFQQVMWYGLSHKQNTEHWCIYNHFFPPNDILQFISILCSHIASDYINILLHLNWIFCLLALSKMISRCLLMCGAYDIVSC